MNDPMQPSEEWMARMDQMRAGAREFVEALRTIVDQLVEDGWSEEQAREIVVHGMRIQP